MRVGLAVVWLLLAACGQQAEEAVQARARTLRLVPRMPELRERAAQAPEVLASQRWAELRDLMVSAFLSGDRRLGPRAARALQDDPDLGAGLCRALRDEESRLRQHAAWQLGQRGLVLAVPALILAYKDEGEAQVRMYQAHALALLGNLSLLGELRDALADARSTAAQPLALAILQAQGLGGIAGSDPRQLRLGLGQLADHWRRFGCGPGGVADATGLESRLARRMLDFEGFQLRQVDEARYLFRRMGRVGLGLLSRCLDAEEPYLRQHALEVLQGLGPVAAPLVTRVRGLLERPESQVAALRCLAVLGDQSVLTEVLVRLRSPVLEVSAAAAGALGPLRDQRAVPALRVLLGDPRYPLDLRVQAAFSLAILEPAGPGRGYLRGLLAAGDYHAPTLRELLQRAAAVR